MRKLKELTNLSRPGIKILAIYKITFTLGCKGLLKVDLQERPFIIKSYNKDVPNTFGQYNHTSKSVADVSNMLIINVTTLVTCTANHSVTQFLT